MKESTPIDTSLKLIAKTSIIVFITLLFSKLFNYGYRIIIARQFGPEIYGVFSLAIGVFGFFSIIASFGLKSGVTRFVSQFRGKQETEKINIIIFYAIKILIISGIIFGILLFLLSSFIANNIFNEPRLIFFLQVLAILIPIKIMSELLLSIFDSYERVDVSSYIENILSSLANVGFLVLFIYLSFEANSIVYSFFASFVIVLLISLYYFKRKILTQFSTTKIKDLKELKSDFISYSWPIMFSGVISYIFAWIDSFSIGYLLDIKQVGLYNAAVPIALLFTFIPTIFIQIYFPLINREYSQNKTENIKNMSKQINKWIYFANIPLLIVFVLFPEFVIGLLFGPEFLSASNSLRILAIGYFIFSIFTSSQKLLLMHGKSKVILYDILLASALNLCLNWILIPQYGIAGAAIATTISWSLLSILWFIQVNQTLKIIPFKRKMINLSFAFIITFIIGIVLKNNLSTSFIFTILLIIFIALIYVLLALSFRSLDKIDIELMSLAFKKLKKN